MFHQSNASQDAKKDDLRHEKSSSDTTTYVVAATTTMAKETKNDAVAPSIELNFSHLKKEIEGLNLKMDELKQLLLESSNEEHDVIDDEVERNDIPMDVNIGMELKDDYFNDDPIIDIAKLFGTPTMSGEFSVYVIPHHLSPAIFKRRREIKKSRILQHPFTDPTKRKKLRKEIEEPLTLFDPLRPTFKEALESFQKWMNKKWFQSLSNHGSWLTNMHIMLPSFPEATNRKSSYFSQKFTIVDTMFWKNAQTRWIKHGKKWNQFKLPENDILIDYANGSQPLYYVKWPDVDIVYVPINVRAKHVNYREWESKWLQDIPQQNMILTLIIYVPCGGGCGMFVITYVE
ncbi:hypothetical protein AAG906_008010 [Vitis piasezkii]